MQREISAQLEDMGINFLTIDEYVFARRANEILKCMECLDDEESAEIFAEMIECRLIGRLPARKFVSSDQYFALPNFLLRNEREVFVDCGAFVGDSVENYILKHDGTFGKIFAFEPDVKNFCAMKYRIERLNKEWNFSEDKICVVDAGVGMKTTEAFIENHNGLSTRISEKTASEGDSIKVYALDDYFNSQKIDFLKADIESFEFDMLRGAEKIIRRDLPKIAVCIYHNASDMYQILNWLDDLNLGYRFSVRHHSPNYSETVLYAYH